jgi:hypothetical protein
MCLYIGNNKEGHIAEEDIICYKHLKKNSRGNYVTPSQNWPVKLDSMLVPEGDLDVSPYGYKNSVNGGAIHAYIKVSTESDNEFFEAYIPKGTRFWIQDDLTEIAAEKLYLTRKSVKGDLETPNIKDLFKFGADVLLTDGSRKNLLSGDYNLSDVKGIFAYDSQVMALPIETNGLQFSKNSLNGYSKTIDNWDKAEKDSDGEKNCIELEKIFKLSDLPALEFCRNNGGYLPSENQLMQAFLNLEKINLARRFLGLELIPYAWFWSSTVRDGSSVWYCYSDDYWGWCAWNFYDCRVRVCLFGFLALIENKGEIEKQAVVRRALRWIKKLIIKN